MKENNEKLQKLYIQNELVKQQINALLEEKKLVEERVKELRLSIHALTKLENVESGREVMASLGSGTYMKADIKDTANVLVNIGAGVVVKKKRTDAITSLEAQIDEMTKLESELVKEINKGGEQMTQTEAQMQKLIEKQKK